MQKQQFRTILFEQPGPEQPKPGHPMFHFQHRHDFLSALSDKYSAKYRLPTMELKRNARVDYYLDRYQDIKKKVEREEKKNTAYLDSNTFNTVFSECIDQRRKNNRQKQEEQKLRQDLQRFYELQQLNHEEPQHDNSNKKPQQKGERYQTVLTDYRSDPAKQKQLYLLDLEIGKLQFEQKIQKKVRNNRQMCRNQQLLSKLSNNILSAYLVHFDQIYDALIDELLTQEVYYLNYLQAQYKVQKSQWNSKDVGQQNIRFQNAKTIQMMELVKKLQDLCNQ